MLQIASLLVALLAAMPCLSIAQDELRSQAIGPTPVAQSVKDHVVFKEVLPAQTALHPIKAAALAAEAISMPNCGLQLSGEPAHRFRSPAAHEESRPPRTLKNTDVDERGP